VRGESIFRPVGIIRDLDLAAPLGCARSASPALAAVEVVASQVRPRPATGRAFGAHVEVVTSAAEVEDRVELSGPGLRVFVGPRRARARDLARDLLRQERRALGALLGQTQSEVIHALWTYEFAWAALDTRRPVVVTARDAPLTILREMRDAYRAMRALMAYLVRARTPVLTAVSPYLAGRWRREMLYRQPIHVAHHFAIGVECRLGECQGGHAAERLGAIGARFAIGWLVYMLSPEMTTRVDELDVDDIPRANIFVRAPVDGDLQWVTTLRDGIR